MPSKISLKIGKLALTAEITSECPKTAKAILGHLPITGNALLWGEEIYFYISLKLPAENAKKAVEIGDIAYWPEGPGIAIFFGKTPASKGNKPEAYSPVNVFARLNKSDVEKLKQVKEGAQILIEKARQKLFLIHNQ